MVEFMNIQFDDHAIVPSSIFGFDVWLVKSTQFCREIAKHLSLPPVKLHCSMLAEDAIKAAIKDYEAKRAKLADGAESHPVEKASNA